MAALRVLLATVLLLAVAPTALASQTVCFTKTQRCCYAFQACGKVLKNDEQKVSCPFNKCTNVCAPKCTINLQRLPVRKCVQKRVAVGNHCSKVLVRHGHRLVWKHVCKPKFAIKHVCSTVFTVKKLRVCKNVCKVVCKRIHAVCTKVETREFIKFCPKLTCGALLGARAAPAAFVSKTGKLIRASSSRRIVPKH